MGTRTVRLDEETEKDLQDIRRVTGLSISDILKMGILSVKRNNIDKLALKSFEIFQSLNVGEADSSKPCSKDAKKAVKSIIKRKHKH